MKMSDTRKFSGYRQMSIPIKVHLKHLFLCWGFDMMCREWRDKIIRRMIDKRSQNVIHFNIKFSFINKFLSSIQRLCHIFLTIQNDPETLQMSQEWLE